MKKINISREHLGLVLIVLLGAFLRFYKIRDYIVFLGDEGRDALVVWNILHGNLTLLGPTSSVGGFFLGPIYYYMMAPFLWLFHYDPVGPAIMVVLIGLTTIALVYKIGKDFFGTKAGLIGALLYAISPTVIIYSRSSWNPNVFPFFTIASLYSLYLAIFKKKWWLFVLSGFLMGINLQIHYLATFVGVIMFVYVLLSDFKLNTSYFIQKFKQYALMFAGFLIGFSPFLAFEARHQFANSQNILRFIFNSPDTGAGMQLFANIQFVLERLFGGLVISLPSLADWDKFSQNLISIWHFASFALGAVAVAFFIWQVLQNKSKEKFHQYLLVLVWLVVGIGLFGFYKKSIYDYYLGFLFPLPFLLVGFLTSWIWKYKKWGKIIAGFSLVVLLLINFYSTPIKNPGNQQVNQMHETSSFVLSKVGNRPFNFALSGGGNSPHAYLYFFRLAGRDPITIQGIGQDPERKTVTGQLFVVCEQKPCSPLGESSNDIAGFGRADIAGDWDINVEKVYKLVHYKGK